MSYNGKLLLLILAGCTLRLLLLLQMPQLLSDDADGYVAHAEALIRTGIFSGPWTDLPTAFRPPLLPFLLSLLMRSGLSAVAAVALLQLVSTAVLLWAISRLAARLGLTPRVALLAVIPAAVDPLLLRYSLQPMTEVPCAAILCLCLLSMTSDNVPDQLQRSRTLVSFGRWLGTGVLFGVGTLMRPVLMIACGLMLLQQLVHSLRTHRGALQSPAFRSSLVFPTGLLCGLLLVTGPWMIRNRIVMGGWVIATTHGGYTLALGNNSEFYRDVVNGDRSVPWDGAALSRWQRDSLQRAREAGVDVGNEIDLDRWYYQLAIRTASSEPTSFFSACLLRMSRFWGLSAIGASGLTKVALTGWYLFLWCGLLLSLLNQQGSPTGSGLLRLRMWLSVLAFCLLHIVYWTDTRMRAPLMPVLILLSSTGFAASLQRLRQDESTDRQTEQPDQDVLPPAQQG